VSQRGADFFFIRQSEARLALAKTVTKRSGNLNPRPLNPAKKKDHDFGA